MTPFFYYCYNSKTIGRILLKLIPCSCYEILHFTLFLIFFPSSPPSVIELVPPGTCISKYWITNKSKDCFFLQNYFVSYHKNFLKFYSLLLLQSIITPKNISSITLSNDIFLNHYYSRMVDRNNNIFTEHENRMNSVFFQQ